MEEIIFKILMDNTHIEGRYTGGGDEPSIIVLTYSEDNEKEGYIKALAKEIAEKLKTN